MFRHREPFVRLGWLAVLEARPPDSERLPRGLIGEFLPLFICCCPRGLRAGVDMPCPSVEESGGPEQGARSGDLEAHQTLPPPPRNGTETWHGMAWHGLACKTPRATSTFDINSRRAEARTRNTMVSSPARLEGESAAARHMRSASAA